MRNHLLRCTAILLSCCLLLPTPAAWATCGGGGGGGTGGMRGSSGGGNAADEQVYRVPWKLLKPEEPLGSGLVLYWFPSSADELKKSSLLFSRLLSVYAAQCITMGVADSRTPFAQKLGANTVLPVAVLAEPGGTEITRVENSKGMLKVADVEKAVETEVKRRENALKEKLESGRNKAKASDSAGAIEELRAVANEKCMFPKLAKDAAKELKKLGVDVGQIFDAPVTDRALSARIDQTMRKGLRAENRAKYAEAERYYAAAAQMDAMDVTPLRYLGELYRHHTGEWDKSRAAFDKILSMPADPLSRAIALHGNGKMTIHDGKFKEGLRLMERSVAEFPTPLAYRNLAVYWNSEGEMAKAEQYVKLALSLDPADEYNQVFASVFNADKGGTLAAEALRIARSNEKLLSASYNLAAIYAQLGQRDKALKLLKRHFYEYERYDAVRAKEMMEARVDAVFTSLKSDAEFVALTAGADGKLQWSGGMQSRP